MVQVQGLTKRFPDGKGGTVDAAVDVTFEARPGRIFGLLGVNGAGKTTTLRMLSTVIKPTAGRARVLDFDVVEQPERVRASIGFLSSSTALYGRLTSREALAYFGGLYGLRGSGLEARIASVTEMLQLHEFLDRLCDKLSTGQKQRVSIARTILHDPPVLFFDEPTAGLDVVTAQTVLEFIERCRTEGKTVIFSTHIMSEAERICDDVAIIHEGRICGLGSVAEIKERTQQPTMERAFLALVGYQGAAVA